MKSGDIVFLSASVPTREAWVLGSRPLDIEEAIVSIARAVFARRGRLLFGGHPSVSPLVSAVAGEYFPADPARPPAERPVLTFQSEQFRGPQLPDATWELHRFGWTSIEWTPKAGSRTASLRIMRERMLDGTMPAAMFAVGGMEGVVDEARLFLAQRSSRDAVSSRIYVLPSGGGAAARLVSPTPHWSQAYSSEFGTSQIDELETFRPALATRGIVDAEREWATAHPGTAFEVPPFAAITQWVLDSLVPPARERPSLP
jgi:SLOG-like protein